MSDRELVYRMRTCAAALMSADLMSDALRTDAGYLLIEAADALDAVPEPIGEPMALLPPEPAEPALGASAARWGGLPPANPRPCPKCSSIDARIVHRSGRKLMLTCPVCSYQWEYTP